MIINKVLNWYYRAYNRAAAGKEIGRSSINVLKKVVRVRERRVFYEKLRKHAIRIFSGRWYWPNTFPTAIDEAAADILYGLVRLYRPEIVVDIGTAKGNSAIAIGQALEDNQKGIVYTIDPVEHEIVKIAVKKSGLAKRINCITGYSTDVIPRLQLPIIDFAFIDGDHGYENCLADLNIVKPYLHDGSVIVFHDSTLLSYGVGRVVEIVKNSKEFECITLPTLSGTDSQGSPALNTFDSEDFIPAGLTICRKIGGTNPIARGKKLSADFDEEEFKKGERLYAENQPFKWMIQEHTDRYAFAKNYLKPDFVVLDAACGSGYGSNILSGAVKKVIGLEINRHAVQYAESHYRRENVEFLTGDLNKELKFDDNYFDAIVSFETLEHVNNQTNMISEFRRVLKPGGILVISTPDKEIISEKAGTVNKFHIKELSKNEFLVLLSRYFKLQSLHGQTKYKPLSFWKRVIKAIVKLDVFRLRQWVERRFNLKNLINKIFSQSLLTDIHKIDIEGKNEYFTLIAVVKK